MRSEVGASAAAGLVSAPAAPRAQAHHTQSPVLAMQVLALWSVMAALASLPFSKSRAAEQPQQADSSLA